MTDNLRYRLYEDQCARRGDLRELRQIFDI